MAGFALHESPTRKSACDRALALAQKCLGIYELCDRFDASVAAVRAWQRGAIEMLR
jgi:hypothetical protein